MNFFFPPRFLASHLLYSFFSYLGLILPFLSLRLSLAPISLINSRLISRYSPASLFSQQRMEMFFPSSLPLSFEGRFLDSVPCLSRNLSHRILFFFLPFGSIDLSRSWKTDRLSSPSKLRFGYAECFIVRPVLETNNWFSKSDRNENLSIFFIDLDISKSKCKHPICTNITYLCIDRIENELLRISNNTFC